VACKNPGNVLTPVAISTAATAATTTAAATTTTSATPPTTTTAGRAFFARTGRVHRQRPALEVLLMKRSNGLFGLRVRPHFDKSEAAGAARRTILHDINRNYRTRLREIIVQIVFSSVVVQVAHK
jgi:hypothetical protein